MNHLDLMQTPKRTAEPEPEDPLEPVLEPLQRQTLRNQKAAGGERVINGPSVAAVTDAVAAHANISLHRSTH